MTKQLNPGSPEAGEAGCTCPVAENLNGKGIILKSGDVLHWYSADCPLHGQKVKESIEDAYELDHIR